MSNARLCGFSQWFMRHRRLIIYLVAGFDASFACTASATPDLSERDCACGAQAHTCPTKEMTRRSSGQCCIIYSVG